MENKYLPGDRSISGQPNKISTAKVVWEKIHTVFLDMDGTLLDRHYDDFFWQHFVPENYADNNQIEFEEAQKKLLEKFKQKEGTLEWTDLDFWSKELSLDIPAMKIEISHLIKVHPYVIRFLKYCREKGKKIYLITNAHKKTLLIKMNKTLLEGYFDKIVCSQEIGIAKENPEFWNRLAAKIDFDRESTLLADDTECVLESAAAYGIENLIYVARPSSTAPINYSRRFPSIMYFKELMNK